MLLTLKEHFVFRQDTRLARPLARSLARSRVACLFPGKADNAVANKHSSQSAAATNLAKNTTKNLPSFFRVVDGWMMLNIGVFFRSGILFRSRPSRKAHPRPPARPSRSCRFPPPSGAFFCPLSCPCHVALCCVVLCCVCQESGREDRHTSLALHSIKLKNFGPFRDEVRYRESGGGGGAEHRKG